MIKSENEDNDFQDGSSLHEDSLDMSEDEFWESSLLKEGTEKSNKGEIDRENKGESDMENNGDSDRDNKGESDREKKGESDHIVTEWIANEGLDCLVNVDVVQVYSFQ